MCFHDVTQQPPPPSPHPIYLIVIFWRLHSCIQQLLSLFQLSSSCSLSSSFSLFQPSEATVGRRNTVMNPHGSHSCGSVGVCDHGKSGPPITAHDVQMFSSVPVNTKGTLPPPSVTLCVFFCSDPEFNEALIKSATSSITLTITLPTRSLWCPNIVWTVLVPVWILTVQFCSVRTFCIIEQTIVSQRIRAETEHQIRASKCNREQSEPSQSWNTSWEG